MVRPHVVFPDQLPADFRKSLPEDFPGSGEAYIPINPENWTIVTDGMYQVTQPGYFHTAGSAHLEGVDFGGKTGTAQVMSHEALDKTTKGRITNPNVWFVGVTPTRNPELVVAVLWQNGDKSFYPARIGAKVVAAYVSKQRRLANNLVPSKQPAPAPAEMGAVWTEPLPRSGKGVQGDATAGTRLQAGRFLVDQVADGGLNHGDVLTAKAAKPSANALRGGH
jgi:penicillin-binding protein 2